VVVGGSGQHGDGRTEAERVRAYRLRRVQQELRAADCGGAVLYDPINIRYATDARNMQVWTMHVPSRYLFVPADGLPTLFEYRDAEHLAEGLSTIGEIRRAVAVNHIAAGPEVLNRARDWAAQIADLLGQVGGGRLAIDRSSVPEIQALTDLGVEVCYGQAMIERARSIKSDGEITRMRESITVAEEALAEIAAAVRTPGASENELWAILNRVNAERGGEWIETRLLTSGPRTRPWFQEAGTRQVEDGDLVALDTDMCGPYGYNADISRTFLAGSRRRSPAQRTLYGLAREQLEHNGALLRAGLSFAEFRRQAWTPPDGYRRHSFGYVHGIGLSVEYPQVLPAYQARDAVYDGVFEAGMVICVESYLTADDGSEGIKLENPMLLGDGTAEPLTSAPFDEGLEAA
jgi:Xaa-Pro dipeptidase